MEWFCGPKPGLPAGRAGGALTLGLCQGPARGLSLGNASRSFPQGLMPLCSVLWVIPYGICVWGPWRDTSRLFPSLTDGLPALANPVPVLRHSAQREAGGGPRSTGEASLQKGPGGLQRVCSCSGGWEQNLVGGSRTSWVRVEARIRLCLNPGLASSWLCGSQLWPHFLEPQGDPAPVSDGILVPTPVRTTDTCSRLVPGLRGRSLEPDHLRLTPSSTTHLSAILSKFLNLPVLQFLCV